MDCKDSDPEENPFCQYLEGNCVHSCGGEWVDFEESGESSSSSDGEEEESDSGNSSDGMSSGGTSSDGEEGTSYDGEGEASGSSSDEGEGEISEDSSTICCGDKNSGCQKCNSSPWCNDNEENCSVCQGQWGTVPVIQTGCCSWAGQDCSDYDPDDNPFCQYLSAECEGACGGVWVPFDNSSEDGESSGGSMDTTAGGGDSTDSGSEDGESGDGGSEDGSSMDTPSSSDGTDSPTSSPDVSCALPYRRMLYYFILFHPSNIFWYSLSIAGHAHLQ